MRDNKPISITAGVVALGAAASIGLSLTGGFGPQLNPVPYEAVGQVLARQTLALLKQSGQVTVISRDTKTFQNPATDCQFRAFRQELNKGGVKIAAVETIQIDPLRPTEVPAGDFLELIKKSSKGDVLVSLMGPPIFNETQMGRLGEIKPSIVAFCSGPARDRVDLRALFSQGLLHAAVVSKLASEIVPSGAVGERQAFDREYVEVTAANVATLSTLSKPTP